MKSPKQRAESEAAQGFRSLAGSSRTNRLRDDRLPAPNKEFNMSKRTLGFLKLVTGGLAALSLCLHVGTASAQTGRPYGPSTELTVFNGYHIAQDLYTVVSGGGEGSTVGLSNSYMYGARLGFYPQPYGGIEFAWTHTGSDVNINNAYNGFVPGGDLGRISYDAYDINFVGRQHNFANPRVTGFGTIGFGWMLTHPELVTQANNSLGSNTLFGINFGMGANVAMNPKLDLRLEGRWKITGTHITTGTYTYCDYWGYCYGYSSSSYNTGELTAGLTYKLAR
jgi:hypothetical protein